MSRTSFRCQATVSLLFILAVFLRAAPADEGREVYKKTLRGVAMVKVGVNADATRYGTCWVVDKARKLLVTNHHVVENVDVVNVIFPVYPDEEASKTGRPLSSKEDYRSRLGLSARVVDTDAERDLAVIQLEVLPEGVEELPLAVESASPGDRVHSVGNPASSDALWVHAEGSVRQVYKKQWAYLVGKEAVACHAWVLETQTPTNPGDSGGPTVNSAGQLVAVVSGGRVMFRGQPVQAMNWSIDVREVKSFVDQTRRLQNPQTAADYALRGERLMKRGRHSQASEDFTAALRLDSNCAAAVRNRGILFRYQGDTETALADLTRAVELNNNDAAAYFERGLTHQRKGKEFIEKALADYTRAIQIDPHHALAYNNRGVLHENRGELNLAFNDYNQAIDKNPNLALAYANRGDIYRKRGDHQKAFEDYDRSYQIVPTAYAVQQAAITSIELGQPRQAINLSSKLIKEFNVDDALAHRVRALGHENLREYPAAVAGYTDALRRDPKHAWTYFHRGQMYEALADFRAVADYEKAVELDAKWAEKLKAYSRRALRIVNNTEEPLRVHLQYETTTEQGNWHWYPGAPPDGKHLTVLVEPGKRTFVDDDGYRVKGRRIRIWADGATTGRRFTTHKEKDVLLCSKEYRSMREMAFTYTFGKPANK